MRLIHTSYYIALLTTVFVSLYRRFDDAYFLQPEGAAVNKSASKTADSPGDTQTGPSVSVSVSVARGKAGEGCDKDGGETPGAGAGAGAAAIVAAATVAVTNGGAFATGTARAEENKCGGGGGGLGGGDNARRAAETSGAAEQRQQRESGGVVCAERGVSQRAATRTCGLLGDDDHVAGECLRPTGALTSSKRPREEAEACTATGAVL